MISIRKISKIALLSFIVLLYFTGCRGHSKPILNKKSVDRPKSKTKSFTPENKLPSKSNPYIMGIHCLVFYDYNTKSDSYDICLKLNKRLNLDAKVIIDGRQDLSEKTISPVNYSALNDRFRRKTDFNGTFFEFNLKKSEIQRHQNVTIQVERTFHLFHLASFIE